MALSMNGVEAEDSSETFLARAHNASDTFWGSNGGRVVAGGEGGGVGSCVIVDAKCDNSSKMSCTYYFQLVEVIYEIIH
jgi:hypothetical protein